jgi:hypothetical protein
MALVISTFDAVPHAHFAMKPSTLRRLHRWVGLACALTVLAASGSGVIHTAMTWTQSPPPRPQPSATIDPAALRLTPAEAIARLGADSDGAVRTLTVCLIAGQPWYQALIGNSIVPRYINAVDGRLDPQADATYAAEIASRHLGGTKVRWMRRLDAYDNEYIAIFRLLPVHRIEADDGQGTRLYVNTLTGSVARHTDNGRQLEANIFSLVHKYGFISSKPWRDGLLVGFTSLAFLTSLAGLVLFFATRRTRSSAANT